MRNVLKCIILTGFLAILSCGKDDDSAPVLDIDRLDVRFETDGQLETYLTVTSNRTVTVSSQSSWCQAELIQNVATGNLKISVSPNETGAERSTTILLTCNGVDRNVTVTVTQASALILSVNQPDVKFDDVQSETYLTVTSNCTVTVQSTEPSWCKVQLIKNIAADNLKISVSNNGSQAERTATILLTGDGIKEQVTVTVIQIGKPFLEIEQAAALFDTDKQSDTYLTITSNRPFSAQSMQPSWCKVELIENATTDNLKISVSYNETGEERTATVLLTGGEIKKEVTVIQAGTRSELNIMTFNIRVISGDQIPWNTRRTLVKRVIIEESIDILGTQENESVHQTYLKSNLPGYQGIGVTNSAGSDNGESNSIFFKQVRFELLESGKFWLSETPDVPGSKSWDSGYIRMAVWVKLKDKITGKQYFVIDTHIDHIGMTAQQKQVEVLLQKIEELRGGLPVILTGDFNMRPENANISVINNSFLTHTRDIATTKTGLSYSYHGYSNTPSDECYLADYIFVSDYFTVDQYSVLPEKLDNTYLSDHAPVVARIRVKN